MHFPTSVVMYPAITWYADTEQGIRHTPTPEGIDDPARWAEFVTTYGNRWNGQRDGVVVINPGGGWPVRDKIMAATAFVNALDKLGWKTSASGSETGWFSCRNPRKTRLRDTDQDQVVMLGVLPWMDQARTTVFALDASADEMAVRLATYERLTGGVWRGTGGLSGTSLLRASFAGERQPRWRWDAAPSEVHGRSFELIGSHHTRPAGDDEGPFVHIYDTRGMYLAGALVSELAWDPPEWRGAQEFDPARPGYWRVNMDSVALQWAHAQVPGLTTLSRLFRPQDRDALVWVTTPIMRYLTEQVGQVEVHDSLTADRQSRIMRGWAERLRDARMEAERQVPDMPMVKPVKDTYSRTIGMLRRSGGRIYRPDWRDIIVDTSKVNLIRKVVKAGVNPLRWNVDAVWIASDQQEAPNLFGDTSRIGGLHHVKTVTLDAYHEQFKTREKR